MEEKLVQMAKFTKVSGLIIKWKEKEYILEKMELHILVNGLITSKMVTDIKNGQMEQSMKDNL